MVTLLPMNWLRIDLRRALLILAAITLPFVSMQMQERPSGTTWYTQPFGYLAGLLETSLYGFSESVRSTTRQYLNLVNINQHNADLNQLNLQLKAQMQNLDDLRAENDRLRKLLDFRSGTKMQLVPARLMSRDLLGDHDTIQINKGLRDGLQEGQAVISTDGVVGYVFRPETSHAHVMLITDRYSVVDGVVARNRTAGIVEGKGRGSTLLRYIEKSEDIREGDLVVTSGLDNIFPQGLPIAKVTKVIAKPYSASLIVEMAPVVNPKQIEDLFVVTDSKGENLADRLPTEEGSQHPASKVVKQPPSLSAGLSPSTPPPPAPKVPQKKEP